MALKAGNFRAAVPYLLSAILIGCQTESEKPVNPADIIVGTWMIDGEEGFSPACTCTVEFRADGRYTFEQILGRNLEAEDKLPFGPCARNISGNYTIQPSPPGALPQSWLGLEPDSIVQCHYLKPGFLCSVGENSNAQRVEGEIKALASDRIAIFMPHQNGVIAGLNIPIYYRKLP